MMSSPLNNITLVQEIQPTIPNPQFHKFTSSQIFFINLKCTLPMISYGQWYVFCMKLGNFQDWKGFRVQERILETGTCKFHSCINTQFPLLLFIGFAEAFGTLYNPLFLNIQWTLVIVNSVLSPSLFTN